MHEVGLLLGGQEVLLARRDRHPFGEIHHNQSPAWPQHPAELTEDTRPVLHLAQRLDRQGGVEPGIGEGKRVGIGELKFRQPVEIGRTRRRIRFGHLDLAGRDADRLAACPFGELARQFTRAAAEIEHGPAFAGGDLFDHQVVQALHGDVQRGIVVR